jgi:sugar O-acyltransferase (sialic acid O-acetyltransferase NeuD family)
MNRAWALFGFSDAIPDILDIMHANNDRLEQIVLNVEIDQQRINRYLQWLDYPVELLHTNDFQPKPHLYYNFGFFVPAKARLVEQLRPHQLNYRALIHPTTAISKFSTIGQCPMIGPMSVITASCRLGDHVRINRAVSVGHDTHIGHYTHVAAGATVCGHCNIGDNGFIGAGSTVKDHITIGSNVLIGAGSVVTKDIPDNSVAYGNPARVVRPRETDP